MEFDKYAVGNVIRKLRKEKKISQEILSGFAGMARSHLAMVENGTKKANFETIWKIANALEMKPHELVKCIAEEITKNSEKI